MRCTLASAKESCKAGGPDFTEGIFGGVKAQNRRHPRILGWVHGVLPAAVTTWTRYAWNTSTSRRTRTAESGLRFCASFLERNGSTPRTGITRFEKQEHAPMSEKRLRSSMRVVLSTATTKAPVWHSGFAAISQPYRPPRITSLVEVTVGDQGCSVTLDMG